MAYNDKFGPDAQTQAQRSWVLAQMQDAIPSLKTKAKATASMRHLYAQYVAGDLSWLEVRQAIDAANGLT
jgi:hypothetical protein